MTWTAVTRGWAVAPPIRVGTVTHASLMTPARTAIRVGTVTRSRAGHQAGAMPREAVTRATAATRGQRVAVTLAGIRAWTRGWPVALGHTGTSAGIRGRASAAVSPTRPVWT